MFNKRYIEINRIFGREIFKIVPNGVKRKWMDETEGNAYRCVPLNVANSYGWTVLSPIDFTATWDGGKSPSSLKINIDPHFKHRIAGSDFGHGILTIMVDFVIRTSKNVSLYVRGVPNQIAVGLQPFDAIVENDWLPFTFTYNFKFTKPGKLTIKKDQPLFTFFPIERGYIESFETRDVDIASDKEFNSDYMRYVELRDKQQAGKITDIKNTYGRAKLYEKEYDVENHTKKVVLPEFKKDYEDTVKDD